MARLCLLAALSSRLASCVVTLGMLTGAASADAALDYRITGAAVHDNLSVYLVHGNGAGGKSAPMTLDEAVGNGQAKLRWSNSDTPVTVENLSDRSVFVPFATLLTGGLQDQVTRTSLLVPPHSGPVPLGHLLRRPVPLDGAGWREPGDTRYQRLCLFPAALPGSPCWSMRPDRIRLRACGRRPSGGTSTRCAAHWQSSLGGPIEPPRSAHWNTDHVEDQVSSLVLAARQSSLVTSLPLMLENLTLRAAQQAYVDGIEGAADSADDVIGAVFAVNGISTARKSTSRTRCSVRCGLVFCRRMRSRRSRPEAPRRSGGRR